MSFGLSKGLEKRLTVVRYAVVSEYHGSKKQLHRYPPMISPPACPMSKPLPQAQRYRNPVRQVIHSNLLRPRRAYRRFADGVQIANCHSMPTVHSLPTATQLANGVQVANCHSLPAATELASRHRACQRYTACQLPHSSLMVYRSPTATACQLPHSLPATTQLANYHTACQLPHSFPAATGLTNGIQLANCHSLPAATELANGIQLANCYTAR